MRQLNNRKIDAVIGARNRHRNIEIKGSVEGRRPEARPIAKIGSAICTNMLRLQVGVITCVGVR